MSLLSILDSLPNSYQNNKALNRFVTNASKWSIKRISIWFQVEISITLGSKNRRGRKSVK